MFELRDVHVQATLEHIESKTGDIMKRLTRAISKTSKEGRLLV